MPEGTTQVNSLADSLQTMVDGARTVREYVGRWPQTCEVQRLPAGTGLSWEEITLAQLSAQAITETSVMDSPQMITDSILTLTPTQCGIMVRVTDKARHRVTPKVMAKTGQLGQQAMDRYKDEQYLTQLDSAALSLGGAGTTLASGLIGAAKVRVTGNVTEPGTGVVSTVLHDFQVHDIQTEILSGVGTYAIPAGLTEETFRRGFQGSLMGTNLYTDGNLTIDSSDDCKGGVHTREGIICLQGMSPRGVQVRDEKTGGGLTDYILYDDFGFGERHAGGGSSGGGWVVEIYTDALAPTA